MDNRIHAAESSVANNLERFRSAVHQLTGRLGETTELVRSTVDTVRAPAAELRELYQITKELLLPLAPYVRVLRRRPGPYIGLALTVVAGVFAVRYFVRALKESPV